MDYIFTSHPNSAQLAQYEFEQYLPNATASTWLAPGVGLLSTDLDPDQLAETILSTPLLYTRHVFPVQLTLHADQPQDDLAKELYSFAVSQIDYNFAYALQARSSHDDTAKILLRELLPKVTKKLTDSGYQEDNQHSDQIVSLFITADTVYAGFSFAETNLSHWNGGIPRYSHDRGAISRAEFKLKEAIETFHIDTADFKLGTDLGAAPGGWSNELLENGLKVIAIDPAHLDKRVLNNPNLHDYRETTQQYLQRHLPYEYDMIVNDMKMDVRESIGITASFAPQLSDKGVGVMTFKLPHHYPYKHLRQDLDKLQTSYRLLYARQLYHNRSEVTVVFGKKKA
ncbi:hypothetical protein IV38_GL002012 [Lactobacillus selangorensis]|uniref:Ribosomal RNA methyltransferase FtsJ domain-containing protein n=1 Tax=Lactobacillus selangorensis TaxID=81857 RepID=A0A0R2FMH7_9LACO|nr:SAM-dependent methyltransferase [Lactobacillus selangorensis]KRN27557.1 hypothetical protein IV38_GL002012 [Lactobacillus selangorensis]KRN30170.1 hypothetical protein IV40_GL002016 [Lactobacillus selangorensis]